MGYWGDEGPYYWFVTEKRSSVRKIFVSLKGYITRLYAKAYIPRSPGCSDRLTPHLLISLSPTVSSVGARRLWYNL